MKSMNSSNSPLPRGTPEAHGMASSALLAFLQEVQDAAMELHSFMLLRRGNVLAEGWWKPYQPDESHMLFSLSKSFTSTAAEIGRAHV